jgi:glycosyltransferase involved in cell wall biosynthesis
MTKCNVLYLMCTELVVDYGIFETQVKSLLKTIVQRHNDHCQMHFLSLVPIWRVRKWYVQWIFRKHRGVFQRVRDELRAASVNCSFFPLLAAYPFTSMSPLQLVVALPLAVLKVLRYVQVHKIDVLHCRSYHAGLIGFLVHKLTGIPYIFDPRSRWLEEHVLIGKWQETSLAYAIWKQIEKSVVKNAYKVVVVSEPMATFYSQYAQKVEVIFTTASDSFFRSEALELTDPVKIDLDSLRLMADSHTLLVFSANRFNKWNDLEHVLSRYKQIRDMFQSPILVILTRTPVGVVVSTARENGVPGDEIWVHSFDSDLVASALSCCHYGLLVMPRIAISPLIMSVKFAEYLASGLPVICDEYIGGAVQVITKYSVGVLLKNDWDQNSEALLRLAADRSIISARCCEVAQRLFSVQVHADRYTEMYQEAITKQGD